MSSTGLGGGFRRLLGASATSNLADGIGRAALPLLAATLTRDPVLISGLYSLAFLPWLLFALPAGALVDRSDRRRAMVFANAARAAVMAALVVATATGHASIALLYVVAFALGAAETVYDSAANALLPQLVRPEHLDRGNSLLVMAEAVGQIFLGGPVGALLFTLAAAVPLAGNAAGFACCALIMMTLAGSYRPALASTASLRADIGAGVRWMLRHPLLRGLTLTFGLTSAFHAMAMSVLVLYALEVLHLTEPGYGLLLLAGGVGGLCGGLVAPWVSARLGRTGTLVLVALGGPLSLMAVGLVRHPIASGALFGLGGLLIMIGNVLTMSLRQTLIPEELFGRVQGAWRTLVWGGIPLGGIAGGALAAGTDVPTVFVVAGTGNLLVGFAVAALLYRHRRMITDGVPEAVREPVHPLLPANLRHMDERAHYRRHTPVTDPGAGRHLLSGLPSDVTTLAEIIGGVVIHRDLTAQFGFSLPQERRSEADTRFVAAILDRLGTLDERPPAERFAGTCRDFTVLLCAILREAGVPARARAGFAGYFTEGFFDDHWVVDVWDDDRGWRLIDAQLASAPAGTYTDSGVDALDVPRDAFLVGGQAWVDCRAGRRDPNRFGVSSVGLTGMWEVQGNVVRDLASLAGVETLPWDNWGLIPVHYDHLEPADVELLDRVAAVSAAGGPLTAVSEAGRLDGRLPPPADLAG